MKEVTELFPTEEDIRGRILLPFLKSIGVNENNIRLEKSFTIQLGRSSYRIQGDKEVDKAQGRTDILIKNDDGKNLFILELKADKYTLTDSDKSQGISYARLLEQIPPFVIVSNGKETKIYDSITTNELSMSKASSEFLQSGGILSNSDDIAIRYEALKSFLSYSQENVLAFTNAQNESNLSRIKGGREDKNKKYIPELYSPREKVSELIDDFFQSEKCVFSITGLSGSGKTNELCHQVDQLKSENLLLFYNGSFLGCDLASQIQSDFDWTFSDKKTVDQIIKRLDAIARSINGNVIIVIDAVDEVTVENFDNLLSEFIDKVSSQTAKVRFFVSCKTEEWSRFTFKRNIETTLSENLFSKTSENNNTSFQLDRFSDNEFKLAVENYISFYKLSSEPAGRLREYCKTPFMLRIISEVYEASGSLPEDFSEQHVIATWLENKLKCFEDKNKAEQELRIIAKGIVEKSYKDSSSLSSGIPLSDIDGHIGVSDFASELISYSIIMSHTDDNLRKHFSFYYSRVRDFILARWALELDKKTEEEFKAILPDLLGAPILRSALYWHIANDPTFKHILNNHVEGKAILFLETYEQLVFKLVPNLQGLFIPCDVNNFGLLYFDYGGSIGHGFCFLESQEYSKVQEIEYGKTIHDYPWIHKFYSGDSEFLTKDLECYAAEVFKTNLLEFIEKGMFDVLTSETLLKEAVIAISTENDKKLGFPPRTSYENVITPIDLDDLNFKLQEYYGANVAEREYMEYLMDKYDEKVSKNENGIIHASFAPDDCDREKHQELAQENKKAILAGHIFEPTCFADDKEILLLDNYVQILRSSKNKIIEFPLPQPDQQSQSCFIYHDSQYSDDQLELVVKSFFSSVKQAYTKVVDNMFCEMSELFGYYKSLKSSPLYISINRDRGSEILFGFLDVDKENCNLIDDNIYYEMKSDSESGGYDNFVNINGEKFEFNQWTMTGVDHLLHPSNVISFSAVRHGNTSAAERAPVRAFVFDKLQDDIKSIEIDDFLNLYKGI